MEDKRRFTRIIFSTPAQLEVDGNRYETSLVDLSLKGALVEFKQELKGQVGKPCSLTFTLEDTEVTIKILGDIAHVEQNSVGIVCTKIDLDSVSHLKRLIALNIGNEQLLDRELTCLSHP